MLRSLLLARTFACISCVAVADVAGSVIPKPDWAAKPTGQDVARHYPDRAARKGVSGWALISCRVDGRGRLTGCRVAAESPEGWEFGAATLALADKFRIRNTKGDTRALEGAKVRGPMAWVLEGRPPPPRSATPGDPSMLITKEGDHAAGRGVFSCPSKTNPKQRCQGHSFVWAEQPTVDAIAAEIRAAGQGRSLMECDVAGDGALTNCLIENSSALPNADLLGLASRYKAPKASDDGTLMVGNRVALTFDWRVLAQVLAVFDAT